MNNKYMKHMKVGLISHSIHSSNLGCSALAISNIRLMDELFAEKGISVEYIVILPESGQRYDVAEFTSLEGYTKNSFSYREYPRPKKLLANLWLLKTTKAFSECDIVVDLCGGDGYTDIYGVKRIFAESIPVFGCKWNHVPCYFGPQTIGPFKTFIGRLVAKSTLRKLRAVFVRDKSSFECSKELGFESKTIPVTDVAFALPYHVREINNGKMNIGINVSGLLYNGGYDRNNYFGLSFSYQEFIDRLLQRLITIPDVQVHLIPHVIYKNEDVDDDYSVCVKLKEKYPQVVLPERFKTASDAKSYISGLALFSGARMHATIGATSSGVPVIPVAYSRKFNGLFDTLQYPFYIDAKSGITVDEALERFEQYMHKTDDMKEALVKAKKIYTDKLKEYQRNLAIVMGLE